MAVKYSIVYLPDELLMEVFKRLSVKSLGRMRCVQKSWNYLIRTPYFISLHLDYQEHKDEYLLFSSPFKRRYSLRFDDKQCKEYCALRFPDGIVKNLNSCIKLYGTSRGLICFSSLKVKVIYVCNPVIGKFIALPDSPLGCNYDNVGLAFGYSDKSNDYKVIKIASDYFCENPQSRFIYVCVYSLSTNSWKTVKKYNFASLLFLKICNSVVVNGAAYWIGRKDGEREDLIVSFDMEDETFREIRMPQNRRSYCISFLQNFGVELSLFYCCMQLGIIYVWVLENEGETNEAWREMVTIYTNEFVERWCPFGFRSNGDIILTKTFECGYMSYDLNLEEATEFVENPEDIWHFEDSFEFTYLHEDGMLEPFDPMYVCPFEENLVLLDDFR